MITIIFNFRSPNYSKTKDNRLDNYLSLQMMHVVPCRSSIENRSDCRNCCKCAGNNKSNE